MEASHNSNHCVNVVGGGWWGERALSGWSKRVSPWDTDHPWLGCWGQEDVDTAGRFWDSENRCNLGSSKTQSDFPASPAQLRSRRLEVMGMSRGQGHRDAPSLPQLKRCKQESKSSWQDFQSWGGARVGGRPAVGSAGRNSGSLCRCQQVRTVHTCPWNSSGTWEDRAPGLTDTCLPPGKMESRKRGNSAMCYLLLLSLYRWGTGSRGRLCNWLKVTGLWRDRARIPTLFLGLKAWRECAHPELNKAGLSRASSDCRKHALYLLLGLLPCPGLDQVHFMCQIEASSQGAHLSPASFSELTWQVSQNKTRQGHFIARKRTR